LFVSFTWWCQHLGIYACYSRRLAGSWTNRDNWRRQLWDSGGHVPHPPPQLPTLIFLVTSDRAAQTLTLNSRPVWLVSYPEKCTDLDYGFVTVYCTTLVVFLCVAHKLFSLSFMPLLAPNPGDATDCDSFVMVCTLIIIVIFTQFRVIFRYIIYRSATSALFGCKEVDEMVLQAHCPPLTS